MDLVHGVSNIDSLYFIATRNAKRVGYQVIVIGYWEEEEENVQRSTFNGEGLFAEPQMSAVKNQRSEIGFLCGWHGRLHIGGIDRGHRPRLQRPTLHRDELQTLIPKCTRALRRGYWDPG